ncbi:hypothetical protein K7X08_021707 [Anisodus acutangulus]|uniref:Uncharacterized protein n=1 Tax=Anisodus acutangulus TaxID=402998 RepID=A0A9Q1RDH2_9SOLA|nr:hypothetical protein K7X08_021707 [Anisodus acutangulus]
MWLRVTTGSALMIASQDVPIDAQQHHTRSHVCSFVRNAVLHACVFLLGFMATNKHALATTTGRLKKENQNALKY